MNQIQRDLTYRLDAVQLVCEQYGTRSEICQQSIQLWELQHAANMRSAQMSFYIQCMWIIIGLFVMGFILFYQFLKYKAWKETLTTQKRNVQEQKF